ncbi:DUF4397 domain-containing protein [Pedobacter sp. JY14-1]|uniref:DUF4397 domain-containing protein n=1 Tax=Pedobacter sp. JY14-1 TaxID=3034151 RepID=UPI0023E1632F|nr:DUF4397 domain-containing protein [Pedobacter sp. JY14-1]
MKIFNSHLYLLISIAVITACKKDSIETKPLASLTVTNAIIGGSTAKIGSNTATIGNNNSGKFTFVAGSSQLYIFPQTDSLKPYYNNAISMGNGEMYSLFLAGTLPNVEAVIIKDNIPKQTAFTAGIRFVNLSPNSEPLNVSFTNTPTINEVENLAYKQYTEFKTYIPGTATSYSFQIRKSSDNSVLATYTLTPIPRSANVTLVIRGLMNGSPGIGIFKVNNDRP